MLKYQKDDSAAFDELYARTSDRVHGYLQRRLHDKALVDDIFQGTYFKFHQTRSRYKPPLPVLPWLFTICHSVMIDSLRSKQRNTKRIDDVDPSLLAADEIIPAPTVSDEGHLDEIAGMKKLSTDQKHALELRYSQDLSFEDIAKKLETSPANVRQLVSRALRRLKVVAEKTRGGT